MAVGAPSATLNTPSLATPPALPPGTPPPPDDGKPDIAYTQTNVACIQAGQATVELKAKPWGQDRLRFDDLHRFATGKGTTVAVIDTGVLQHSYFQNRLIGGGDYGTEVAGIIAANPRNPDVGFIGIAPDAQILSIRQTSSLYEGAPDPAQPNSKRHAGTLRTLAQAIVHATNAHVDVINMSVDNCVAADEMYDAAGNISGDARALQAALRNAVEHDVVPVASAGNTGENGCKAQNNGPDAEHPASIVLPPWFSDDVLSVGAMDQNGDPASFSVQGPWVSVAAPGTNIISLDPADPARLVNLTTDKDGKPSTIQGTSFAAPYVAGLAALVKQRFRDIGHPLSARQIMDRIKATALHPAAAGNHDVLVGYGMIDPISALTTMIPAEAGIPAATPLTIQSNLPPSIPRDWTAMRVALLGSGGGVLLLLLTLFVVHTVRRRSAV
jgi:membrane-anchored mycosin MYCP